METIVDLQTELICQYDTKLRLTYINRAYSDWLGIPKDRLLGTEFMERIPLEERENALAHIKSLTADHPVAVSTHRSIQPDGTSVTIEWTDRALFDETGILTGYLGVGRDVTEREQQARQIFNLKEHLTTILDTIQDAILYFTLPDQQVVYASIALQKIFGYPAERFINEPALHRNLIHPDDLNHFLNARETCFREGYTEIDHRIIWPDGQVRWLHRRVWVRFDSAGQPSSLIDTAYDITERKKSEINLREANQQLENLVIERTSELEKADDRLVAIFNHSGDGLVLLNLHQGIQQANHAFETLLGIRPEDYLGKPLGDYFQMENSASIESSIREIASTHCKQEIEAHTTTGIPVELSIAPVNRSENTVINLVCIVRDITERKRAEATLKQYATEVEDLYNNAPGGYHSLDRDGIIARINDTELNWLGYSREEVVGKLHIFDIIPPSSQAMFKKNFPILAEKGLVKDLELELIRKDGNYMPVLVSATAIKDESGNFLYSRSTIFDNTERKKAEEELQVLTQRLQLATEAGGIGIWDWNLETDYVYMDDQLLNLHSVTRGSAGSTFSELWGELRAHPDDLIHLQNELNLTLSGQKSLDTEFRIYHRDESLHHIKIKGIVIRDVTGRPVRMIGVNWDITRLKEAEENLRMALEKEKELGELKSRFVSMASHEFRTPLAAILATTETLTIYRNRMDKAQIDNRLEKIRQQGLRLKGIMDEVLEVARMQAGRVEFKPAQADLDQLCQEIVEEYESLEPNMGRIVYLCQTSPVMADFDPHLLRQAIGNLISNALKYSPIDKPVKVKLTQDSKNLVLVVQDQGIGIPVEDQKYLFEPFHRAQNVGTIPGTGLGLTIAKQAVELHKGSIKVVSTEEEGTTFMVIIPIFR